LLTGDEGSRIFDCQIHQTRPGLTSGPGNMGCHQTIPRRQEWVVGGRRLNRKYVHTRARQPSGVESVRQVAVDDQRPARGVDQDGFIIASVFALIMP
jgi:hypothetical protein